MDFNSSQNGTVAVDDPSSDLIFMVTLFRDPPSARYSAFAALLLIYAFTVAANAMLGLVIYLESNLHRPMYVLMALLAITDVVESTTALPRIMANLVASNLIPIPECIAQMFFYHVTIRVQSLILTTMSVDRYVAIVHPLRYHLIMSNSLVFKAFLATVALAGLPIFGYVAVVVRLNYCRMKVTSSPNCHSSMLLNLSCSDPYPSVIFNYINITTGIILPLLIVVLMYLLILLECRKPHLREGKGKAIHTCVTHIFVITVFFSSILFTFVSGLKLQTSIPGDLRSLQTLQYVLPPVLNPVVYGLRTAEIRRALARRLVGRVVPGESKMLRS
ncbi:olfactory receptor 8H1-like [Lethenteron reissneri]|uniref:olfactory receptor 8H1-like n=1 Tax=Lethenteron reissneri TaxID=7753 RepID=UPI002AB6D08F|nr:olfactory receptor 8H1-like [Lethenteron reissneri]